MEVSLDKRIEVANNLSAGTRRLAASGNIVLWSIAIAVLIVLVASSITRQMLSQAQARVAQADDTVRALENNERRIDRHWGHVHVQPFGGGNAVWLSPGYDLTRMRCKTFACYRIDKISE
jgi:hypothetical protein